MLPFSPIHYTCWSIRNVPYIVCCPLHPSITLVGRSVTFFTLFVALYTHPLHFWSIRNVPSIVCCPLHPSITLVGRSVTFLPSSVALSTHPFTVGRSVTSFTSSVALYTHPLYMSVVCCRFHPSITPTFQSIMSFPSPQTNRKRSTTSGSTCNEHRHMNNDCFSHYTYLDATKRRSKVFLSRVYNSAFHRSVITKPSESI